MIDIPKTQKWLNIRDLENIWITKEILSLNKMDFIIEQWWICPNVLISKKIDIPNQLQKKYIWRIDWEWKLSITEDFLIEKWLWWFKPVDYEFVVIQKLSNHRWCLLIRKKWESSQSRANAYSFLMSKSVTMWWDSWCVFSSTMLYIIMRELTHGL